jgi:hypothetical protein
MAIDPKLLAAARAAFPAHDTGAAVKLGAVVAGGDCHPEPLLAIPTRMFNRHGLIAGATGTGNDAGTPEAPPEPPIEGRGSSWGEILNSPLARTIANQVTRGLMGALLGPRAARRAAAAAALTDARARCPVHKESPKNRSAAPAATTAPDSLSDVTVGRSKVAPPLTTAEPPQAAKVSARTTTAGANQRRCTLQA